MATGRISLLVLASAFSIQVTAATFVIQNNDGPGEGFNDPNPPANANQKGNNPGTTLGEMRLKVFAEAAKVWGNILNSNVTINIGAQFNELGCTANSGTLGFAGANNSVANFTGSDSNVTYPIALAESLKKSNMNGTSVEIHATFNNKVDSNDVNCLGGGGFYYGLDGNVPSGTSALFPVVLHELAHGLGFVSFTDIAPDGSGAFSGAGGFPDVFSRNLLDLDTGKSWDGMNNAERKASALNEPALVWKGATVTADRDMHLGPAPELVINAPAPVGTFEAVSGQQSAAIPGGGVTAGVFEGNSVNDLGGNPADGCSQITFGGAFTNKIVLFDKSDSCSAAVQTFYSQIEGAVGLIIADTTGSNLPDVSGGINNPLTIPYIGINKSVADQLRTNIGVANTTIRNSAIKLMGENQGRVKMFAPVIFEQGSSVSHWSKSTSPDLLMEPVLGTLDFADVDITAAAFNDIGWSVNIPGGTVEVIFKDGFE